MSERVAVVGGGINGLVAANYLRRGGAEVSLYERQESVGGACISDTVTVSGVEYEYPKGATVLGLMQDFVFAETGLSERLEIWAPDHAKAVYFDDAKEPVWIHRDPRELASELESKCGEAGRIEQFRRDEAEVIAFLQEGFRAARPPRLEDARRHIGHALTERFIEGSARDILDHYFTSERTKLYLGMTVIESGPVSLDAPFSAFNLPLLDSGSVFGGYYGFVKGGIWQITRALETINAELGVETLCERLVTSLDDVAADRVVIATDPVTAFGLAGLPPAPMELLGTSGKVTFLFRKPPRWKDAPEADTAFRFVFASSSLEAMEQSAQRVVADSDFEPGYIQLYGDGAAMRHMGYEEPFERVVAFVKNLGFGKPATELPEVEEWVKRELLQRIDNPEDLAHTLFLSPMDLKDQFFFPEGNVDHSMMTTGQNFSDRHFSSDPDTSFYRLGSLENVFYCGAGAYPCGSVAGTPGYMCAQEVLRSLGLPLSS